MAFKPVRPDARLTWRSTQRMARNLDRQIPQWWKRDELVYQLLDTPSVRVHRCWRQLIKQRIG